MKLAMLSVGDAGKFPDGRRFVVTNRVPDDRHSGWTDITYEDNCAEADFRWDVNNPEVTVIGKGKVVKKVIIEER